MDTVFSATVMRCLSPVIRRRAAQRNNY